MKTILRFYLVVKNALRVFRKKPISIPSSKLQKLPAQKTPSRFSAMQTQSYSRKLKLEKYLVNYLSLWDYHKKLQVV